MSKSLDDLYNLIANGNKEIKQDIQELRHDLVSEIEELKSKNKTLEEEIKTLNNRLLATERKAKKYNLIVYGVQGDELRTTEEILHILNQKLHINCCRNDFRDIFRIGKHSKEKCRPVIIETINYDLKQKILINARKQSNQLRENRILFTQDLAQEDYKIKTFLSKHLKEARSKQYNAFIKNNILVINGEEFTYEYLQNNDIPDMDMDNAEQIEANQEQEINSVLDTTLSELPSVSISKSNSAPTTPTEENICRLDENKKRKFENTPTKHHTKPKIQTRSQNRVN